MKHFLGIDVGTTSVKAAVFDETGRRLALRSVDYALDTDAATGFIEFDAERYATICRDVARELRDEVGGLDAISVDTQGETLILADADGHPLCPAVVWLDNRATQEADDIRAHFGSKLVYDVTGQPEITAGWPASKLLWFQRNRPEVWKKVRKVFLLEDWILYSLTGRFVTEPTIQSSTIYFDIRSRRWWPEMLDFIGVDAGLLPEVRRSAEAIGEFEGTPVVTGGLDQIAGSVGAGVADESTVSEMTGTIMAICALTDTIPPYRTDSIIPCHLHAIEGMYCRILWTSTAGMALKWFKNTLSENFSFADLDRLAEAVPPGSDGLVALPYFTGSTMPKYNPDARAVFAGVTLGHTRGHFARAIMESIAFLLRQDLEYLGADSIGEIRITGGGASSRLWSQIKADVTGKTLRTLRETETACLGSAIFAAVGVGAFPSIPEAARAFAATDITYAPSGADYGAAYAAFGQLDDKLNASASQGS